LFFNNLDICHIESSGSQLSLFSLFSTISPLWTQFWVSVDTTWTPRWTPKSPLQRQDKVYQMTRDLVSSFPGHRAKDSFLVRLFNAAGPWSATPKSGIVENLQLWMDEKPGAGQPEGFYYKKGNGELRVSCADAQWKVESQMHYLITVSNRSTGKKVTFKPVEQNFDIHNFHHLADDLAANLVRYCGASGGQ
jgi:hypothetical protein